MKFSLVVITLLPLFVRAADIPVAVGQSGLTFEPSSVTAAEGDVILFSFYPKNHTVTESSFATPCTKLVDDDGPDDADSGFIPVTDASTPTVWNYTVTTGDPIWFYCAQASPVNHCTSGMVFAVNPTAERTFEAFQQNARNGGTSSSTTGTGTGTGTANPTNTSPSSTRTTQTSSATTTAGAGNGAVSMASSGAASLLAIAGVVAAFAL